MYCKICSLSFSSNRNLENHITEDHNLTKYQYRKKKSIYTIKTYCIICHREDSYNHEIFFPTKKSCCKNKIMFLKDPMLSQRILTKAKENNRLKKERGINNYSNAAYKRERRLRETIIDGKSLKEIISQKSREKISNTMKQKIFEGKFKPNITNSWANSKLELIIDGNILKFRSCWEAIFYLIYHEKQFLKYEKTVIKYRDHLGKERNYITDFTNDISKIIYEIKPYSRYLEEDNLLKEESATNWCNNNDFSYKIIDDIFFFRNMESIKKLIGINDKLDKSINQLEKSRSRWKNKTNPAALDILKIYWKNY